MRSKTLLFLIFFTIVFPSLCTAEEGTLEGNQTCAILVQGSKEPWTTHNLKLVYSTLIKRGVPRENIVVVSPLVFLALKADNLGSKDPDLDGDGKWDVTLGPTFNNVAEAFERLGEKVKHNQNADIFLYFTMHGLPDTLCLESITKEKKNIESVELKEWIRKNFPRSQEIILFMDACYSGSFREVLSDNRRDYLFFAAAQESKQSYWGNFKNGERFYTDDNEAAEKASEPYGWGVFTYYFFSALNGGYPEGSPISDADVDGNGIVSLEEAYRYAYSKPVADFSVPGYTGPSLPLFERFQIEDLAPPPLREPLGIPFSD